MRTVDKKRSSDEVSTTDGRDEVRGIVGMFLVTTMLTIGFLLTCLGGAHSQSSQVWASNHASHVSRTR